jgi:hypothetical protein
MGSMRAEYNAGLEQPAESVACAADNNLRAEIKKPCGFLHAE